MKKTLFSFIVATILSLSSAWSQNNNYDFWSVASNGDTLYYVITTSDEVRIVNPYFHQVWTGSHYIYYSYDGYTKPQGALVIPDSVYYEPWNIWCHVTSIGNNAFFQCTGLTSVVLPSGITSFSDKAFYQCNNLVSINLPDGLNHLGDDSFNGCSSLLSIDIPNGVTYIDRGCFCRCSNLQNVTLPSSIITIGDSAFMNCYSLVNAAIPENVTTIRSYAFSSDTSLLSVIIPNSTISIGNWAFGDCNKIKTIVIPNTVQSVGSYAFYGEGLDSVYVNGETSLGEHWFGDNIKYLYYNGPYIWKNQCGFYSLQTLELGDSVRGIGDYTFANSPVRKVILGFSLGRSYGINATNYGFIHKYAFQDCSQLDTLICKSTINLKNQGDFGYGTIFSGCNNITYFEYHNNTYLYAINTSKLKKVIVGVGSTSSYGLSNCDSLQVVELKNNVGFIGNGFFNHCIILDTIFASSISAPSLGVDAFLATSPNKKVIVPCNSNYDSVWGTTGFVYITGGYTLTLNSNNTLWGNAAFVQQVDCNQTAIIEATPTIGHRFVQWSDGNTDNPRTIMLSQNTTLSAVFEAHNVNVSATSNNDSMGSVTGGGSIPMNSEVSLSASPACGHRFVMWNDSITSNPRTFIADKDTSFIAYFELAVDTIELHDTTYINVPVHDTTIIIDTVTLTEYVPVHDTTYIDVHDTTYINVPVHDTTIVTDTITLTEYVPVHDTTIVTDTITQTEYVPVHDTTYITQTDTVTVTEYLPVHDTTYITFTDTVTLTQHDTIDIFIHDTLTIIDTLWLMQYDTIFIHDTIYITQENIDGVDALNAKVYFSQGQIVVEGADGNNVVLYDITGRTLVRRQDEYLPLRFDVPTSGTYIIKIGNYPARKVVVIR